MTKDRYELAAEKLVDSIREIAKELFDSENENVKEDDVLKPGTIVLDERGDYNILRERREDKDGIYGKAYYITCSRNPKAWLGDEQFEVITPVEYNVKVGDKIIITDAHQVNKGDYEDGDIMTVRVLDGDGDVSVTDKHRGVILAPEFEIIERPEEDPRDKFNVGDKVRLKDGGEIYPLRGFYDGLTYEITEPKCDTHESGERLVVIKREFRVGYATADQLELVTETNARKRKKDEVREGDIVRVIKEIGGKPVGSVFEVKNADFLIACDEGYVYGERLGTFVEMVATVEDLAELKENRK